MTSPLWQWHLAALPDPAYPSYRLIAGGDPRSAIQADGEHLLRTLAAFKPDSVSVAIRFLYRPGQAGSDPQQRFTVYLAAQAHHEDARLGSQILLDRCPLRRFYDLRPAEADKIPWDEFQATCDVVRRQEILAPTLPPELNPKIPPVYWTVEPFCPREDNDYLLLDSVTDRLDEPVLIEICIEPADHAEALAAHTRYLAVLQQINRSWDSDDEETFEGTWRGASEWRTATKPLRQRDPLADTVLRRQQRFHETLPRPHLRFHIRAFSRSPSVARLLASVVGDSAFEDGSYQLLDRSPADSPFAQAGRGQAPLRVIDPGALATLAGERATGLPAGIQDLANLATPEELTGAFRLPIASASSPRCIRKNTDPPLEDPRQLLILGQDEQHAAGAGSSENCGLPRGIRIDKNLAKHLFIAGVPGSGKTISAFNILLQLARRRIPFLVFEPAKTEYRTLKTLKDHSDPEVQRLANDLQIYTPGNETVSPMRFNPLQIPDGIGCYEHIENICRCFQAAMPMGGPMPALLAESLERVYERYSTPDRPPRMADLYATVKEVSAEKGYSGDVAADVRAAIEVRLGALTRRAMGQVLQSPHNAPSIDRLMTGHSVIELAHIPGEKGCLLTLFLLTAVREYVKTVPWTGNGLRLVVVLEEAHNVVGRAADATPSEENADPKAYASQFICEMLAELRAMGVAIIIVDQLPSAVAPEVIKNTGSKLAFREVDREDRESLGATMLFGPIETEEIARLQPGEAYFFTEGYFGPRRIRTPNLQAELSLPAVPMGTSVLEFLDGDSWFTGAAEARIGAEMAELLRQMNDFEESRERMRKRMAWLIGERFRIVKSVPAPKRPARLRPLGEDTRALHKRLCRAFNVFRRDVYRPLMGTYGQAAVPAKELQAFRDQLRRRFESVIEPGVKSCLQRLERFRQECQT